MPNLCKYQIKIIRVVTNRNANTRTVLLQLQVYVISFFINDVINNSAFTFVHRLNYNI